MGDQAACRSSKRSGRGHYSPLGQRLLPRLVVGENEVGAGVSRHQPLVGVPEPVAPEPLAGPLDQHARHDITPLLRGLLVRRQRRQDPRAADDQVRATQVGFEHFRFRLPGHVGESKVGEYFTSKFCRRRTRSSKFSMNIRRFFAACWGRYRVPGGCQSRRRLGRSHGPRSKLPVATFTFARRAARPPRGGVHFAGGTVRNSGCVVAASSNLIASSTAAIFCLRSFAGNSFSTWNCTTSSFNSGMATLAAVP